jgi:3-hydroxyisobutyrate dehydrogenase-like beta-hydroxyacid dehydrogenase
MKVTVLGLGNMGAALAARLLETGHQVMVWNRTPGKAQPLVAAGAHEAGSLEAAVRGAEAVITLLSNDAAVKAVALDGNVVGMLDAGTVLVDMSTVSPETSREIGAATPGGRFVDAPVLGGPGVFAQGKAKLLLGGNRELIESLSALWGDLSAGHCYTGPNGTATTLKLLSNLMLVGGTQLLMEAVVTGRAHGFRDDVLREVLGGSPAVAPGVRVRLDEILNANYDGWWTLRLARKDLSLVLELAQQAHLELPMAEASRCLIQEGIEAGYGDRDLQSMTEVLKQERMRD